MPNISRKTQLETRAAKLTARLKIDPELDVPCTKDREDIATEREADEVLEMIGLSGQQELRQIAVALNRLAQGTYGVCAKCGDDIVAQRLDLLPDTPFCARCAV
jgi:RNA polymerase-binding transcription factor DksA